LVQDFRAAGHTSKRMGIFMFILSLTGQSNKHHHVVPSSAVAVYGNGNSNGNSNGDMPSGAMSPSYGNASRNHQLSTGGQTKSNNRLVSHGASSPPLPTSSSLDTLSSLPSPPYHNNKFGASATVTNGNGNDHISMKTSSTAAIAPIVN
jgi:hypothetical protein